MQSPESFGSPDSPDSPDSNGDSAILPIVVGTAGHIDHGKSTLVQALTGIDPDRLKEEKERGLTIDLSPCPHAASQADHRERLCAVHLGLMQAVLAQAGGPLQATGIRSSVCPTDCIVELARA